MTNRLILSAGSTFSIGAGSSATTVFGSAGVETLTIAAGATVTLDASFNRGGDVVTLAGNAASYTITKSGSSVILTDASGSVTIPVGIVGMTIAFADAVARPLVSTNTGDFTLGAQAVTATATAVSAGAATILGEIFTLTTGSDNFPGTAANDTINGVVSTLETTLNLSDTINGGGGVDTLAVVFGAVTAGDVSLGNTTISGVEIFNVRNVSGQAFVQNFALITGETGFINNISTNAVTANNLGAGTDLTVIGNGAATNNNTTADYVAAATSSLLTLVGGITAGALNISGAGLTSQTFSSTGAANTIGALTLAATTTALTINAATALTTGAITGAALASITINGSALVDIDAAALPTTVRTVSGSASTGAIRVLGSDVTEATVVAGFDGFDLTIATGSGADLVSLLGVAVAGTPPTFPNAVAAGKEYSISTGGGDDRVLIGAALVSASATIAGTVINGGDGFDVLQINTAQAGQAAVTSVSNFEQLRVQDTLTATVTPGNFQAGLNNVLLWNGANAGGITFATGGGIVELYGVNTGALTVTVSGTATTDSVVIRNVEDDAAGGNMLGGQALNLVGIETTTIVTTTGTGAGLGVLAQTVGAIDAGTGTIVFEGANRIEVLGAITARTVNASGLTPQATGLTFEMNNALLGTGAPRTITGSGGDDVLIGHASATTINGGAGDDTITGGAGADIINGGDGDDTIVGGLGADVISGGAGDDTITLGAATLSADGGDGDDLVTAGTNLTFGMTVTGGAGIDTLSIADNPTTARASGVSGFEQLTLTAADTYNLANFINNSTFSQVNVGALGASSIAGVTNQTINLTGVLAGDLTVLLASAAGTSDSATVAVTSADALGQTAEVILAGVETINLSMVDTNATPHQNTVRLTAAAATAINVTGNAGVIITGADLVDVITLDASGLVLSAVTAAGVNYTSTNVQVGGVTSITGSNGVDVLTGNAITNDTISGGAGADTLVYTGGADIFTGGAGNDTFDINADGTLAARLVINDFSVGDIIDIAGVENGTATFTAAAVTLGAAATFQNFLDASAAATTVEIGTVGGGNSVIRHFQFDGDTFLVVDNSNNATFLEGTDTLIELSGLLDLSGSGLVGDLLTFALA